MNDTPRIEDKLAEIRPAWDNHDAHAIAAFTRALERELNAACARIAELETELGSHAWEISPAMAEAKINQLFAENQQLKQSRDTWKLSCDEADCDVLRLKAELTAMRQSLKPLPRPDKPGWWWVWIDYDQLGWSCVFVEEDDLNTTQLGQWLPATPPPMPEME